MRISMKRFTAIAALGLALAGPAAALVTKPVAEEMRYRAYIGGLPLGELTLAIAMDESEYAAKARFDMTALLRIVLDTDARASASGSWQDGEARPELFEYWVRDRKKKRTTEMRFNDAGDPVEVVADPPFRKKSYSMTIDEAAGAFDPATAAVVMTAHARERATWT